MRVLNLTVKRVPKKMFCVFRIDGNEILWTSTKENRLFYSWETEQSEIRLEIFSFHEMSRPKWFWYAFFFFIISVFGIFNRRYEKTGKSVKYEAVIPLSEDITDLNLTFHTFKDEEPAIKTTVNKEEFTPKENIYYIDSQCQKRVKKFKTFEILWWVMLVILAVVIAVVILL